MSPPGYRFAVQVAHRLPGPRKLAESVAGRRGACARWLEWASSKPTKQPLVWVHAASVGEGLTAEPIIARLKAAVPSLDIVLSYSSPSVSRWAGAFGAAYADYVPLDEPGPIRRTWQALSPSLMVFARGDLWPELVTQAHERGIPLTVVGGSVRASSRRLRWPARSLLRTTYGRVSWLGAASQPDARRWIRLGVPVHAVEVTGDPRHDQVLERVADLSLVHSLREWAARGTVLVAGSTDTDDEAVVLEAFRSVARSDPCHRLLLVPHEPEQRDLNGLLTVARRNGITAARWDGKEPPPDVSCVVVSLVGMLAHLYALADIAYVGGGFRRRALHAVTEPAAYAIPIVIGPRYRDSVDAESLVGTGGAVPLSRRKASADLTALWQRWARDDTDRTSTGLNARRTLQEGASGESVHALLRWLDCS